MHDFNSVLYFHVIFKLVEPLCFFLLTLSNAR